MPRDRTPVNPLGAAADQLRARGFVVSFHRPRRRRWVPSWWYLAYAAATDTFWSVIAVAKFWVTPGRCSDVVDVGYARTKPE